MPQALAAMAEPAPVRMMLANDELRVVLVTIHVALRCAIDGWSPLRLVLQTLRIRHRPRRPGLAAAPRIAVAGLNPHAARAGCSATRKSSIIAPVIEAPRAPRASTPAGPSRRTRCSCRPHCARRLRPGGGDDARPRALIPVKYLGVEQGVNVTLGLPSCAPARPRHCLRHRRQRRADASSPGAAARSALTRLQAAARSAPAASEAAGGARAVARSTR